MQAACAVAVSACRLPGSPAACSLQFFSRVFPATRFAFIDDLKQVLADVSVGGCAAWRCLALCMLPRCGTAMAGVLRPPPSGRRLQLKWYLLFLVAVMVGFGAAFTVLFAPDAAAGRGKQAHTPACNMPRATARQGAGGGGQPPLLPPAFPPPERAEAAATAALSNRSPGWPRCLQEFANVGRVTVTTLAWVAGDPNLTLLYQDVQHSLAACLLGAGYVFCMTLVLMTLLVALLTTTLQKVGSTLLVRCMAGGMHACTQRLQAPRMPPGATGRRSRKMRRPARC